MNWDDFIEYARRALQIVALTLLTATACSGLVWVIAFLWKHFP